MVLNIRKETTSDIEAIDQLTISAFLDAPHTGHNEHLIVRSLRGANALTLSLVAVDKENVIGHVAISKVLISDGSNNWVGLGPISVSPKLQRMGIGTKLMQSAIEEMKSSSYHGCVVLGDPLFYERFGFRSEPDLFLPGVPCEYFQAISFTGFIPKGNVKYHEAFYQHEK